MKDELPDIQKTEPIIKIPINQCGVENVEVPFTLECRQGGFKSMIANVSMRTSLDSKTKGISMSRLLGTLKKYLDLPLKHQLIFRIMKDMAITVESPESFMTFKFLLPTMRHSPKTDNEFPIFHKCTFEAHFRTNHKKTKILEPEPLWDSFKFFQGVRVQYASYCPCSGELSKDLMEKGGNHGFPHAQRSFAHILVQNDLTKTLWLEDIIGAVEDAVPTLPYPIIKRPDEQEIAKIASENPMFVEDSIRAISSKLNKLEGVYDWIVKCIHEESIHSSEAIAINYKGLSNGFDYRNYL